MIFLCILDCTVCVGINLTPLCRRTEKEMFTSERRIGNRTIISLIHTIKMCHTQQLWLFYFRAFLDSLKKKPPARRQDWIGYLHNVCVNVMIEGLRWELSSAMSFWQQTNGRKNVELEPAFSQSRAELVQSPTAVLSFFSHSAAVLMFCVWHEVLGTYSTQTIMYLYCIMKLDAYLLCFFRFFFFHFFRCLLWRKSCGLAVL